MVLNHLLLITTYVIINLGEVESNCPKPEIWPEDLFLYENEQLTLSCTIKDNTLPEGTLELRKTGYGLLPTSTTVSNNTHLTIQFNDAIKSPANPFIHFLFYECVYKSTNCSETEITSVAFDAYPRKPQHISCVIYDKEGIKCKIDLDGSYRLDINSGLPKEMKVMVKMQAPLDLKRNNWVPGECEHTYKKAFVNCTWNADTKLYTMGRYTFNVSVVNTFRYDSVYSILEEDVYVKPDLVRNITITTNTTALGVTWKHDFRGSVGYEIQLRSHGTCWETAKTQHTEEHFVVFNDLESYSSYNISIIAYPVNEDRKRLKYNSDPVYSQIMTKADVPATNPKLHLGSFRVADDGQVYLYWTPLKDCQANGPRLVYEILLFGPNDLPLSNETKTATEFSAILSINRSVTYMVYIKSRNSVGYAIHDPSHLQISNQRPQFPKSIIVEWIRNRTVSVSWLPLDSSVYDISDYTVYWCRTNDSYTCNEPINIHIVLSNTTTFTVTISSLDFDKHIFGVSAEMQTTTGQLISSGIYWSTCYYSRYALPLNPMETALKYTDDGVNITWVTYPCSRRYGRIVTCIIYIKNEDNRIVKKIPVSSSKGFFIVKNMPPGRYKFSVAGIFPGGMGPPSKNISFLIEGEISWALIIPVVVGSLIIVAVSIVSAVKIRNYCREASEATRDFDFTEIEIHNIYRPSIHVSFPVKQGNQQSLDVKLSESLKDSGISTSPPCEIQSNAFSVEQRNTSADSDEARDDLADYVVTTNPDIIGRLRTFNSIESFDLEPQIFNDGIEPRGENVFEAYVETADLENTIQDQNEESSTETTELLSMINDENDIQHHDETTESQPMINCQDYVTVERMNK